MKPLNKHSVIVDTRQHRQAVTHLCDREAVFADIVQKWGPPPMWSRPPGFVSLLHIILEQQVSLASAQAVMNKLRANTTRLTPKSFLMFNNQQLRKMGFSRQKMSYARGLAKAIIEGTLSLSTLKTASPETAYAKLVSLRGIGPWTANIYLMMALRHANIWPSGDLALRIAVRELFNNRLKQLAPQEHSHLSEEDDLQQQLSQYWQPYRSVAVRICWLHYLRVRHR